MFFIIVTSIIDFCRKYFGKYFDRLFDIFPFLQAKSIRIVDVYIIQGVR